MIQLKRPTAKGIFGYLHVWFHASHGRPVEKDYSELCLLLNIPAYKHASKIKETMGRSLDELKDIGYLSSWDIKRMVSKEGFKLVLLPGEQLGSFLALSQRKLEAAADAVDESDGAEADAQHSAALGALIAQGISEAKAQSLLEAASAGAVLDQIEYANHLVSRDRRGKFENPAGFIIYSIENNVPIPKDFLSARRTLAESSANSSETGRAAAHRIRLEEQYDEFVRLRVEAEMQKQFAGKALSRRIDALSKERVRKESRFAHMSAEQQREIAQQILRREISDSLPHPSFDEWNQSTEQMSLFADAARN